MAMTAKQHIITIVTIMIRMDISISIIATAVAIVDTIIISIILINTLVSCERKAVD